MYYLFYIPIGTEARVRQTPWGTIALACVSLGAFLYFLFSPGSEPDYYRFMLHPGAPSLFTSITSSFLHSGWLHLVSNLIYLGIFAPPIESRIGTGKFLAAYLCFAGLANLTQAWWMLRYTPELSSMPILGASGAVAGVMGTLQAVEVLKELLGLGDSLDGRRNEHTRDVDIRERPVTLAGQLEASPEPDLTGRICVKGQDAGGVG